MPLGDSVPWSGLPRHNARAIAEATGPFPASSCDPPPSRAEAIRTFHLRAGITERGRHTRERQNWPGPETWSLRSAFLWFWAVENLKSNEPESEGQSGPSSTVDGLNAGTRSRGRQGWLPVLGTFLGGTGRASDPTGGADI